MRSGSGRTRTSSACTSTSEGGAGGGAACFSQRLSSEALALTGAESTVCVSPATSLAATIAAGVSVSDLSSLLPRLVNADAGDLTLVLVGVVVGYMVITLPSALAVNRIERRVAILR